MRDLALVDSLGDTVCVAGRGLPGHFPGTSLTVDFEVKPSP